MIEWLYSKFLWFWGFHKSGDPAITGDEHITDMLRRQKQRFGQIWWVWSIGWLGFWVWLFLHILGVKL